VRDRNYQANSGDEYRRHDNYWKSQQDVETYVICFLNKRLLDGTEWRCGDVQFANLERILVGAAGFGNCLNSSEGGSFPLSTVSSHEIRLFEDSSKLTAHEIRGVLNRLQQGGFVDGRGIPRFVCREDRSSRSPENLAMAVLLDYKMQATILQHVQGKNADPYETFGPRAHVLSTESDLDHEDALDLEI